MNKKNMLTNCSQDYSNSYTIPGNSLNNKKHIYFFMENEGKIEGFLSWYSSKSTRKVYRSALNLFFSVINKNPESYFNEKQDYKTDVVRFAQIIADRPPKTYYVYLSAVKKFLQRNEIDLKASFWQDLKTVSSYKRSRRALTEDRIPTNKELRKILNHCSLREKTILLMLLSSGMRIGEALEIKREDIDLDYKPAKIELQMEYTKTGLARTVFISDEAREHLIEWLEQKDRYIEYVNTVTNLPHRVITQNDNRLFPFSAQAVRDTLVRILKRTGLDEKDKRTGRYLIHLHSFRKFFKSKMSLSCPVPIVEKLMGHEGYLSSAYDRYSVEDLAKHYKEGMEQVTVFSTVLDQSEELEKLKEQIEQQKEQIEELEKHNTPESLYKRIKEWSEG